MQISAKTDYAVRALLVLAAEPDGRPLTGEAIATSQGMPVKFVENTLVELRRRGLVTSQRGPAGGFKLAVPANRITVADVVRAVHGPLAEVRGVRPEHAVYGGPAEHLQEVWIALRASLRSVLEQVTLADVTDSKLPAHVQALVDDPASWV